MRGITATAKQLRRMDMSKVFFTLGAPGNEHEATPFSASDCAVLFSLLTTALPGCKCAADTSRSLADLARYLEALGRFQAGC